MTFAKLAGETVVRPREDRLQRGGDGGNAGRTQSCPSASSDSGNGTVRYYWQPGDADVQLPCGASICNAGWEDDTLQLVMKEPLGSDEWSATWEKNWYFLDTRTDTVIYPEPHCHFGQPDEFDSDATDADWRYFWRDVTVDKEALPYLELHWGGKGITTTVLPGDWRVTLEETPVTIASEVLAEDVPLTYGGEELTAEWIECSKLSVAVYFADYVDSHRPAFSARSGYLTRTANLSPAIGALLRIRPTTAA